MPAPSNKKKHGSKKRSAATASATLSPPAIALSPPATTTPATAEPPTPPSPVSEEGLAGLIALAKSSPDTPLGLIWKHAFEEGSKDGFKRGTAFFKDLDVKTAFREGATQGQMIGIISEREEWEMAGHGDWCFTPAPCVFCEAGLDAPKKPVIVKSDAIVQADIIEALPPPSKAEAATQVDANHILHSSSSQTDPPPMYVNAESQAQDSTATVPASTIALTPTPSTFDWSEDAASIPIIPTFPNKQLPRDFSALRTHNRNPFSSIARRNHRHRFTGFTEPPHHSSKPTSLRPHRFPPRSVPLQTTTCRQPIQVSTPATPPSFSNLPNIPIVLDWDTDPRLSDLSRALKALGWIRG